MKKVDTGWEPLFMKGSKGQIFVLNLLKNAGYTFEWIQLAPGSEIPYHVHTTDCEWYINEVTGENWFCPQGEGHCFINDTDHPVNLISLRKVM